MTHRERVDALVEGYLRTSPDLTADLAAVDFARFAAAKGSRVRVVHAAEGDDPRCPEHSWVRVMNAEGIHGYDVDVTGGRFAAAGEAVPDVLVWSMDGAHPIAGVFRTLRAEPAVGPGDPPGQPR